MELQGRVALVTGSTSGIGLGIARALAAQGVSVMLNGLGEAQTIEALRADLETEFGVPVLCDGADMRAPGQVEAMLARASAALGRIEILVNNAGIQHVDLIEDFPAERWDTVLAINLSAAFHAMRAAIPSMKQQGWGRIINIASAHGLVGSAGKSAYVAAKHGIIGLTKVAAIELADSGVTANAICPGWVRTPLVEQQLEARARRERRDVIEIEREFITDKQPMGQFTTPAQIGALAVFLCSESAATITGAAMPIDGGWTSH